MDQQTSDHDKLIRIETLVEGIEQKIDSFILSLRDKADRSVVEDIKKKVDSHEKYISEQITLKRDKKEITAKNIIIVGFIITIISSLLSGLVAYYLSSKGIH